MDDDASSAAILRQSITCRGALDGFIAEVIGDHIRERGVDADDRISVNEAAEEPIGIVRSCLT
ncbi:MAG: metal-sensing transcriptional repressor [Acetobacteraceae bacterium]